ncbi:MAG TPA: hypothetical protein VMF61_00010 [Candidatus Acidoferrales bacterium]|nr:hypothetical protein [Candidatus Acidoferrales bacterium]
MIVRTSAAVLALIGLSACTTGQANTTPPVSAPTQPRSVVLQVSVGTINFAGFATGLNVLETFRGPNGYTAFPISTAKLSGPHGFRGPKGSADPGSGVAGTIPLGSASDQFVIGTGISAPVTSDAAADGWGIGPPSCSCGGINFYPMQPQFADVTLGGTLFQGGPEPYYGGPPDYPPTTLVASALSQLVSIPSGWAQGFYMVSLLARPPTGTYALAATYLQNGAATTTSARATLHSAKLLPSLLGQPAVASDHHGGLIVTVHFVPGVKQMIVDVIDANVPPAPPPSGQKPCATGLGFASLVFDSSGTKRIPDDLGNYGQGGAPTFCKGDLLSVNLMAFDYDDFSLGPPANSQQRPALPAQADMSYSTTIASE